jgi:hypothetical protein
VKSRPTATLVGLKRLVDYLCESTSWQGQRWTRKMTPSILIFRNEINALGNFRGGDKLARDFAQCPPKGCLGRGFQKLRPDLTKFRVNAARRGMPVPPFEHI